MKFLCVIGFLLVFANITAQNNDLEAQYLYHQAEDSYNNGLFTDCIDYCEFAVKKLGSINKKIVFLELQAFSSLLKKKCNNKYLIEQKNNSKIYDYISFYLDSSNVKSDEEKLFKIMKFKEEWLTYVREGCPRRKALSYDDLNFGIKVATARYKGLNYPQIYSITDGTIIKETDIRQGFILQSFWLYTENNIHATDDDCKGSGYGYGFAYDEASLVADINCRLKFINERFPDITELQLSISGHYAGESWGNIHNYKIKISLPEN